ncbi:MAG: tRNA adenosine(34) deaminase TadA [Anaerolineaceae bacterium]|nr:tRNA adenosine(34) deaminase TadA [Anaerolineaceae bacterium]MCY4022189.1 tRNA adenosine(34) deaminase TadA [Anaerolineaceae bacterium]
MPDSDEQWMRQALAEAERALASRDVPVGALAVRDGAVIGRGHNRREADGDPCAHAEIIAIREAARQLGQWRLEEVTLYCTLEPCVMCAGAMVLARLPRLVYAAVDPKAGAAGSVLDLLQHSALNHRVECRGGVLAAEAAQLLQSFFRSLRQGNGRRDLP